MTRNFILEVDSRDLIPDSRAGKVSWSALHFSSNSLETVWRWDYEKWSLRKGDWLGHYGCRRSRCLTLVNLKVSGHGNLGVLPMIFQAGLALIFKELNKSPEVREQVATKMAWLRQLSYSKKSPLQGPSALCLKSPVWKCFYSLDIRDLRLD